MLPLERSRSIPTLENMYHEIEFGGNFDNLNTAIQGYKYYGRVGKESNTAGRPKSKMCSCSIVSCKYGHRRRHGHLLNTLLHTYNSSKHRKGEYPALNIIHTNTVHQVYPYTLVYF